MNPLIGRMASALFACALIATACGSNSEPDAAPIEPTTPTTADADTAEPDGTTADAPATVRPSEVDDTGTDNDTTVDGDLADDASTDDEAELARWQTGSDDVLFDQDALHTFELTLSDEDLAFLDADPTAEEYVDGTLTFDGETLPVGIRYKGSVGAFVGCLSGPDLFSPSGSKTCTKLSMKVKINRQDPDALFYGVRKLQFHSMNNDPSQMHERLGYWMFREMGVPGPRAVHAQLIVNGEFMGVFALVEQIDGRFTRANFDDGTGNVYKETWPLDDQGRPRSEVHLRNGLETNEDEDPTFDIVVGFGEALAEATASGDDAAIAAVMEQYTDVDQSLAYIAVDRAIANDDGALHWYCFGPCSPHNFFWYEDPTTELMHLIPWDLDNAFANLVTDANPVTPIADEWGVASNDCEAFVYGGFGLRQRSAVCDPVFGGWALFEDRYDDAVAEFFAGPGSAEQVEARIAEWSAQIADATALAAETHPDAISITNWERSMQRLLDDLDATRPS